MAGRIQIDTVPAPFEAPLQASRDGGLTFTALTTTTVVGTPNFKRGFLETVPGGTYPVGAVRVRPVDTPAAVVNTGSILTVQAAATAAANNTLFQGTSRVADERPRRYFEPTGNGPHVGYAYTWVNKHKAAFAANAAFSGNVNYAVYGNDISAAGMLHSNALDDVAAGLVAGKVNILHLHHWINNVHGLVLNQATLTVQQMVDAVVLAINDYNTAIKARATTKTAELRLVIYTEPTTCPTSFTVAQTDRAEAVVTGVNAHLRTNYVAMGFLVVADLHSHPQLGGLNVPKTSTLFLANDFVHYSDAGHQVLAEMFAGPATNRAAANTAGIVSYVAPAATTAPALDKTRFLVFYEARTAGNTLTQMQDLSGKLKHATRLAADTGVSQVADVDGRAVYRHAAANQSWRLPELSGVANDYTVYAYVRTPASPASTYFLDVTTDRTVCAMNSADGYIFSGSFTGVGTPANVVGLNRCCWQLNSGATAAAFLLNNVAQRTGGTYAQRRLLTGGRLGSSEDGGAQIYVGDLIAFAVAAGNDTATQRADVDAYFAAL